jgi:UDP-galactopyranose mutase
VRFVYDNNYFNDRYQGIPIGGYTQIIESMLAGVPVFTGIDYKTFIEKHPDSFEKLVYTGPIDEYYDYKLGHLQYRTVRFETERLQIPNFQGNAVVNYTEREIPWTRIIEHKHFEFGQQESTVISREYSEEWKPGMEPYYPVNDEKNNALYEEYRKLAELEENVLFGGRLGTYRYYNMDQVIAEAVALVEREVRRKVSIDVKEE